MINKKGFTLVELIVSFVLITVISLAFFQSVLTLQEQQQRNMAKNSYKAFTIVLNKEIQGHFLNDKIEKISSCGVNCYDIVYSYNGEKRLSIDTDNSIITYGSLKEKLPSDYKLIGNVEFNSYISDVDGYNSFVLLTMSFKSSLDSNIETLKYMYQYDSKQDIIEVNI